jgi:hypothetical protein
MQHADSAAEKIPLRFAIITHSCSESCLNLCHPLPFSAVLRHPTIIPPAVSCPLTNPDDSNRIWLCKPAPAPAHNALGNLIEALSVEVADLRLANLTPQRSCKSWSPRVCSAVRGRRLGDPKFQIWFEGGG